MEKKAQKVTDDLLVILVWHRVIGIVDDDLAYVALLRVRKWAENALTVLEQSPARVPDREE